MFRFDWLRKNMDDSVPKLAFTRIKIRPDEKIYEICITLKDVHGAISSTAKVMSDAHINLRTATLFDAIEKNGVGYWTSFVDLSRAVKDIQEIEDDLRKLDVVEDVKIVKSGPLAYDVIHFPLVHGESAAAVMPAELFGSLFDEIEKTLSPSGFVAVFYNAGKKSGAFIAELFRNRYGLEGESLYLALVQATKTIGWGQVENLSSGTTRPSERIKMRRCFEAILRGSRKEHVCHWTRGFLAGFLSEVVGKPLEVAELKCAAVGDELCEFEVESKI